MHGFVSSLSRKPKNGTHQSNLQCYLQLLSGGAAVSVARLDALDEKWHSQITAAGLRTTVGADGLPLEVVGQVTVPVSLGDFQTSQEFTVVKSLTANCILGADFLVKHSAVIDCRTATLALGDSPRWQVPISIGQTEMGRAMSIALEDLTVTLYETIELPACSVSLVTARVNVVPLQEGLVEPLETTRLPKHLLIARTLTTVGPHQEVSLQITNSSPSPTTIHKGCKLGRFTPYDHICLLGDTEDTAPKSHSTSPPNVDLEPTDLSTTEKKQLLDLLTEFSELFATPGGQLGRTAIVKHTMSTTGPPICQPLRRLPESLKGVVQDEVQKMLQQGVVSPSDSHGLHQL